MTARASTCAPERPAPPAADNQLTIQMKTTFHTITLVGAVALFVAQLSFAKASDSIPARPQQAPILLQGATVHPVVSEPVEDGKILFIDGKIANLGGPNLKINLPAGTQIVDVSGKHVYPGMIAAKTTIGLVEINAVRATRDLSESGRMNANARAEISVNPDSEIIPVTRANGVLTALTVPQTSGGLISGRSALIALDGWTWEEMVIKAPVGLHVFWPGMRGGYSQRPGADPNAPGSLQSAHKRIKELEEFLAEARAYTKAPNDVPDSNLKLAAMAPVLDKNLPLFIHANDVRQIQSAMAFAEREDVSIVIVGGRDAWRVSNSLKERDIPVILSAPQSLPGRRWEPYDTSFRSALKLHEAGVSFCIANDGSAPSERNLPYQAAAAASFGLPPSVALKAVTLFPARILGMEARLGSLEEGKDATLIVTDGDPLEITTNVESAYIQGRKLDLSSRHTRLYKKYREKYRQLKAGS